MSSEHKKVNGDSYEVVVLKFKERVPYKVQGELMAQLNSCIKKFEGFKCREYYYCKEGSRWIDIVVWESPSSGANAAKLVMDDPSALKVFSEIDETTMIFGHYERIGGIQK